MRAGAAVLSRAAHLPLPRPLDVSTRSCIASKAEVEEWKDRDPIAAFKKRARDAGLIQDADIAAIEAETAREIDDALTSPKPGHSSRSRT